MARGTAPLLASLSIAAVALAGCAGVGGAFAEYQPHTREMTFWVEAQDWELHPNVHTPVWSFCGEGDGVEPMFDGPCGVPGPTVRVMKGDTIRLTFRNDHSIPHSIHFHGWHPYDADMNGNAILGDAMVVAPGTQRTIEWVAEPAGSFIYHCHFQTPTHMEMGMYGAFIVEDPEAQAPDVDYVGVLDEWQVRDTPRMVGAMPAYNVFTINGKSFPLTQPILADKGDHVRIHLVNAGYEFHAMHVHGYTPDSWEGVAGPSHAVPTDVREIAPGQTVVLDFTADREGIWLFHDHVVPHVTVGTEDGFGAYPRGMLTVLAVGQAYQDALVDVVPGLLAAAQTDMTSPVAEDAATDGSPDAGTGSGTGNDEESGTDGADGAPGGPPTVRTDMKDFAFQDPTLEVKAGTQVVWLNRDNVVHTVTFDDGSVDSGDIGAGKAYAYTFDTPGTYPYHCTPHSYQDENGDWQGMVGTVLVT